METTNTQTMENSGRPSWTAYFLEIASVAAKRSNCLRRKVGAVLVKDNQIIATGYNGTPAGTKNCSDGGCPRCSSPHKTGEKLDECLCVHAEQNAICQAAKFGNSIYGATAYITCSPCLTCAKLLISAGVKKIVFANLYGNTIPENEMELLDSAGVEVYWRSFRIVGNVVYAGAFPCRVEDFKMDE